MNKMILIFILYALPVIGIAQTEAYIVPEILEADQKRQALFDKKLPPCRTAKFKTFGERQACKEKVYEEAREKYPHRATREYVNQNYVGLDAKEIRRKIKELEALLYEVRGGVLSRDRKDGELTRRDIDGELSSLRVLLDDPEAAKALSDQMEKAGYY